MPLQFSFLSEPQGFINEWPWISRSIEVKSIGAVNLPIHDFILVLNSNILRNSALFPRHKLSKFNWPLILTIFKLTQSEKLVVPLIPHIWLPINVSQKHIWNMSSVGLIISYMQLSNSYKTSEEDFIFPATGLDTANSTGLGYFYKSRQNCFFNFRLRGLHNSWKLHFWKFENSRIFVSFSSAYNCTRWNGFMFCVVY